MPGYPPKTHHKKAIERDLPGGSAKVFAKGFAKRFAKGSAKMFEICWGVCQFVFAFVLAFVFVFVFACVFTERIVSLYLDLYLLAFSFVSAFVFTFVVTESKNAEDPGAVPKCRGRVQSTGISAKVPRQGDERDSTEIAPNLVDGVSDGRT